MTSTVPDLPVPDEVFRHRAVVRGWLTEDDARSIAAAMIAAELRRLADEHVRFVDTDDLRRRADELDPS